MTMWRDLHYLVEKAGSEVLDVEERGSSKGDKFGGFVSSLCLPLSGDSPFVVHVDYWSQKVESNLAFSRNECNSCGSKQQDFENNGFSVFPLGCVVLLFASLPLPRARALPSPIPKGNCAATLWR